MYDIARSTKHSSRCVWVLQYLYAPDMFVHRSPSFASLLHQLAQLNMASQNKSQRRYEWFTRAFNRRHNRNRLFDATRKPSRVKYVYSARISTVVDRNRKNKGKVPLKRMICVIMRRRSARIALKTRGHHAKCDDQDVKT